MLAELPCSTVFVSVELAPAELVSVELAPAELVSVEDVSAELVSVEDVLDDVSFATVPFANAF